MNAYSKTIPTCSQLVNHSSPNSERLREGFILNTDALHITTIQFTPAHNYIRTYPAMHIFTCARIQPCTSSHLNLHISLSYSLSLSLSRSLPISLSLSFFSLSDSWLICFCVFLVSFLPSNLFLLNCFLMVVLCSVSVFFSACMCSVCFSFFSFFVCCFSE